MPRGVRCAWRWCPASGRTRRSRCARRPARSTSSCSPRRTACWRLRGRRQVGPGRPRRGRGAGAAGLAAPRRRHGDPAVTWPSGRPAMGFTVVGSNVDDAGSVQLRRAVRLPRGGPAGRAGPGDRRTSRRRRCPRASGSSGSASGPSCGARPMRCVGVQAFQDMALLSPLEISLEQWEREWITDPDAMFVALADGEVIGCAGLLPDPDDPGPGRARADRRAPGLAPPRRGGRAQAPALAWAARSGLPRSTPGPSVATTTCAR